MNVQVAMTDAQSEKFEFTRKSAESLGWTLALRPVSDATDSPERLETLKSILCDGMRPGAYSICTGR